MNDYWLNKFMYSSQINTAISDLKSLVGRFALKYYLNLNLFFNNIYLFVQLTKLVYIQNDSVFIIYS